MRLLVISVLLIFLIFASGIGLAKEWRGIVPLKSTRADVERLLGANKKHHIVAYHVKGDVVSVVYSTGMCSSSDSEWNVPADIVTGIEISLKDVKELSSLPIDLRKFERVRGDSDLPNHNFYINREEGFQIEVQDFKDGRGELVTGYVYGPTLKDKSLKCSQR